MVLVCQSLVQFRCCCDFCSYTDDASYLDSTASHISDNPEMSLGNKGFGIAVNPLFSDIMILSVEIDEDGPIGKLIILNTTSEGVLS